MADGWQQFRLLLWKDYLVRKRKWIALSGIAWAIAVVFSLYIVRSNIDNVDFPTCQFPARALPSAGMIPFLQSFICSVNNECSSLDKYEDIPTYENSKLTQLQRKFSPLLYNETVLDTAATVPDALKLLSKLAEVVDEPSFIEVSKNGLKVYQLFNNPRRVQRYVSTLMHDDGAMVDDIMKSDINIFGIFKGIGRCNSDSISQILKGANETSIEEFSNVLCSLPSQDVQQLAMRLIVEIDFNKFIKMLGSMYSKLSGDTRVSELAATVRAVLRMTRLDSFLPRELAPMLDREHDFTYIDLGMIHQFLELFRPTFSDTESFKTIKDIADTAIIGLQYIGKVIAKQNNNTVQETVGLIGNVAEMNGGRGIRNLLNNAVEVLKESAENGSAVDVIGIISHLTNFVYKWLPDDTKHEVLLYSTLLTKLIEATNKVININMHLEQMTYNVSLRHPQAIKTLVSLPGRIIGKGFEGLRDAERAQIATSRISSSGQLFCDQNRLQNFLQVSKSEASSLKDQLCNDEWKNFISDLVQSFGVYEVRDSINQMASIFIQETLGKDTSDQLYTLDYDFQVLKNFSNAMSSIRQETPEINWNELFHVTEDSDFMQTIKKKAHLGKQILIIVHGCLAKEVVKQNAILSFKISPFLIDTTTIVLGIVRELDTADVKVVKRMRELYPDVVKMVLATAMDEDKVYKCLSLHYEEIFCSGVENASLYVKLPETNAEQLVTTLCDVSRMIENGLAVNSEFGKAIEKVSKSPGGTQVHWTNLISGLKNLYVKLYTEYPYVFQYADYGMDNATAKEVKIMVERAKTFWFGRDFDRSVYLSIKIAFKLLDLADQDIFNITNQYWLKTKYSLNAISGPLFVLDDVVKAVQALYHNTRVPSSLPPITLAALTQLVPNLPRLMTDAADLLVRNDADEETISTFLNTEPYWPCSGASISEVLNMTSPAKAATRALETLMCVNEDLKEEWGRYLEEKGVDFIDLKSSTLLDEDHVFLRFSSALDALANGCKFLVTTVRGDDPNKESWTDAAEYVYAVFDGDDRDTILRQAFTKFDRILDSVSSNSSSSVNRLWTDYVKCVGAGYDDDCRVFGRSVWKSSVQFVSVILDNVAEDLLVYFKEVNDPDVSLLQILGFTKNTPLYGLYQKLPEFIGVLLNSYFDYGFMSQIRKAALTEFWDCDAVVSAMTPAVGSKVDEEDIARIQPYICPSFLYWISLPRGDNTLLDLVAKPNYFLYTVDTDDLKSSYLDAFDKILELSNKVKEITDKNVTAFNEDDLKLKTLEHKLTETVDSILNYTINDTDASYRLFNQINRKQFASTAYLRRIVVIINKIFNKIDKLQATDLTDSKDDKISKDLKDIQNIFKRKPHEAIALHFDLITNLLWKINDYYIINDALDAMCDDLKNNITSKDILVENQRTKDIFCSKNYKVIYKDVESVIEDDLNNAKKSLLTLVSILQNDDNLDNVTDINSFLNQRVQLISSLRKSIKYAYELSLPIYQQYLESNLEHYDVILSFLAGGDWWGGLRALYHGPYATKFLDAVESSFDIAQELLSNLDRIHIVRLLHDVNVNSSDTFCEDSVVLSEYIPDRGGRLSELKTIMCREDKMDMYRELPPLVFASQGYDINLKLPLEVNHTSINHDISDTESLLNLIRDGPMAPRRPSWVTDEKLIALREVTLKLLSKETLTKIGFGLLSNLVDTATLFLNNSHCPVCSQFTTWFKQLNLQVFKKQEYDALYCRLQDMSLPEVYHTLQNDFHWDMAIQELVSTRNYTKYELNKSINHFLELVKLHLLEDLADSRLSECLARNVTRNDLGNVTLFFNVLSHTAKLFRAVTPHLHEIPGFKDLPYMKQLHSEVAHNLDAWAPLKKYLKKQNLDELKTLASDDVVKDIMKGDVDLKMLRDQKVTRLKLNNRDWDSVCDKHNCSRILSIVYNNIDTNLTEKDLPTIQSTHFWRLSFVSSMLDHIQSLCAHVGRATGAASKVRVNDVMNGQLEAVIDLAVQIVTDDTANAIVYSLYGLVEELHPLLQAAPLELDLSALAKGLDIIYQFKNQLLKSEELRLEVSKVWTDPDRVEASLTRLGINNTNFWSLAAPRVHAGHIDLRPIFASKQDPRISPYICQLEPMSRVIQPGNLDVVTADDVFAAILEQFCGLEDGRAKEVMAAVVGGVDFSAVLEKIKDLLLPQLFASANLTFAQGSSVLDRFPRMAALLPVIQGNVGDLAETLAKEPLVADLGREGSVGGLLGSPSFLKNAGNMLCGRPFQTDQNRFYKAIAQSEDFSDQPDQAQLDVLPTDFCRDLYRDILNMEGGKIVWSFVKPLIMGKILYTPSNHLTDTIIEKANASFAHMIRLTSLVHSLSDSLRSVELLSAHREGARALRRLLTSPEMRRLLVGGGDVPDVDVDGVFDELGDMQGIGKLLQRGSNLLRCINLNRFRAVSDEYQLTHQAVALSRVNEFSAGIVFLKTEQTGDVPSKVEYKIRMDIENVPTTTRKKSYFWIPGPESSFIENMRYFRGFVQIQDMVDNAIIQLSRSHARRKRETDDVKFAMYAQQEPYPCYKKDYFQTSLYESQTLVVVFFFALMFSVSSIVRFIVTDKESGNTMLMSVMGVDLRYHTLSWASWSLLELCLAVGGAGALLVGGGVLPRSEGTLLGALLGVFAAAVLAFCYMMSKLFTSASSAAVCTGIGYLFTFMPFVLILSLEAVISAATKMIVCLSMSTAFSYCLLHIARLEAMGEGASWHNMASGGVDSIAAGAAMMVVDTVIYVAIGMLLDKYFGLKTLSSNITQVTTSDEKAGVSIVNVSKSYGEKKVLDNVSIELQKGQITTLLGHNGAGKTTLINILTGMSRPTSGHIVLRSSSRTRLGVCPQRDVLVECLSAAEHVALYARLKGGRQRDSILDVLSLGAISTVPACKLSGGTRRRLCVALAFVAEPDLVSLDEPTAGVDPAARREIWSMIVKLRADRTVLLTTHHLDEAELLSDQIVIMHKGQVHTTGSPVEIKRSLGNGYKLNVVYPDRGNSEPWEDDDEMSIEERSKQLLSVVRSNISNAGLAEVSGLQVDLMLPFFDGNGVNNDFHQVCSTLETRQQELGFKSYNLDCSSLEQVFFSICQKADAPDNGIEYGPSETSKSASTSSVRSEESPLVGAEGPLRGSARAQFAALLRARFMHYRRNSWLLFLLVVLPSLFVAVAMAFSLVRPPADNELVLPLTPSLYEGTEYLVPQPSIHSKTMDPSFAARVMDNLRLAHAKNWTSKDTPSCKCAPTRQECESSPHSPPAMMLAPDVGTLNEWIVASHDGYIEKRYGGYTSSLKNNITALVAWYNNKGHHALPAFLNSVSNAVLRTLSGNMAANITVYSHPLKISKEQISKDTVYQHVADAGIAALVLVAYCLVTGGGAVYLVSSRRSQEKRLQLLCGVSPVLYWGAALAADMLVVLINLVITVIVFEAFGFPVFVARSNLPAICLLILLYGFACSSFVHLFEKLFSEPSLATMVLFCGNAFLGLVGIALLLILDIISESEATDNARWVLHKIFMLAPQFVLGDGLLEIAKNTVQAQVLERFGMDTYRDPLRSPLVAWHYLALVLVGGCLAALNLAVEYGWFDAILTSLTGAPPPPSEGQEPAEVSAERRRVRSDLACDDTVRLPTIANINAGFVDTEVKKNSIKRVVSPAGDVAAAVGLSKMFPALGGARAAVRGVTLGIPRGQCTVLLGENGAGKSTTFGILTGEVRPSAGHVWLRGERCDARRLCGGLISYCPQNDALDPLLTVTEILEIYCQLRGISEHREVIKRTLGMFELSRYRSVRSGALSGGNRRKLCTAVAFMGRAPLVLLDEPTSGMDPVSRACVPRAWSRAGGRGVLLSTHALSDARRLASRVALMREGRLVALAPLDDCLTRFGGGYVVSARSSSPRALWAAVTSRAPHASLQALHHSILHFLIPTKAVVDKKEVVTPLSDIFRLMGELQASCDIEDYTVNQSSLDQMFLSFTKGSEDLESVALEPLPSPEDLQTSLSSITTL